MKEPHPADALTEALLAYAKAKNMGQDYVAGYLNHVLRRVVDRLPGYHRNIALADLKMSLRLTEDALKEIQK
jgi:hypothetical protein